MFQNAIELAGHFTRPVFTLARTYGSHTVMPGAQTLFFVNEDGWAVTTKHTAQLLLSAGQIEKRYAEFKAKREALTIQYGIPYDDMPDPEYDQALANLTAEYKYTTGTICQLKVNFIDCVDKISRFECKFHKTQDLALIKFEGWEKRAYRGYAKFAASTDIVKPGKFLCRIGYPYPEFKNFTYDEAEDTIRWTQEGNKTSPRFPSLGMVTRLIGADGKLVGIELNSPAPIGIDGGPVIGENGLVYGMHVGTTPLKLGQCIHAEIIKAFLDENDVKYYVDKGPKGGIAATSVITPELLTKQNPGGMMN